MAKNPKQKLLKATDFAARLGSLMAEAGELGLYQTMHKIHDAVRVVGFELAEKNSNDSKGGES